MADDKYVPKKGLNFKQTPQKKVMLVEPETFRCFLETLEADKEGIVSLQFQFTDFYTSRHLFAKVLPIKPTYASYEASENGIDFIRHNGQLIIFINPEVFLSFVNSIESTSYKTWKGFYFNTIHPKADSKRFAYIKPTISRRVAVAKAG